MAKQLTFTNSNLRNFSIGINPRQDGSFRQVLAAVRIRG